MNWRAEGVGTKDSMNVEVMIAGIKAGLDSTGVMAKEEIDSIMSAYAKSMNEKETQKLMKAHDDYIKKMSEQAGVKMTESGLMYKIISEGAGVKPDLNDTVVVSFKATFADGKEFYASRPESPDRLPVNIINNGLTEGLPLMSAGSVYEFYIPQHLGYGEQGNSGLRIPPYSALKFTVDLKNVVAMPNK
jgi:FKBP-type peptidyl-prolyl cis-trans isomerase